MPVLTKIASSVWERLAWLSKKHSDQITEMLNFWPQKVRQKYLTTKGRHKPQTFRDVVMQCKVVTIHALTPWETTVLDPEHFLHCHNVIVTWSCLSFLVYVHVHMYIYARISVSTVHRCSDLSPPSPPPPPQSFSFSLPSSLYPDSWEIGWNATKSGNQLSSIDLYDFRFFCHFILARDSAHMFKDFRYVLYICLLSSQPECASWCARFSRA